MTLQRSDIMRWLDAHGINGNDVSAHDGIRIVVGVGPGGVEQVMIAVTVHVRNADGQLMIDQDRNELVTEHRLVPMKSFPQEIT